MLSTGATEGAAEMRKTGEMRVETADLHEAVTGLTVENDRSTSIKKDTPLGVMFVHITEDDKGQPFEVFVNLGKAGGSAMSHAEAIGRLISLALRSGIPLHQVHRQLRGISSDKAVGLGPNKVMSVPDAIGLALEEWMRAKQGVQQELLVGPMAESGSPSAKAVLVPVGPNRSTSGPEAAAPLFEASGHHGGEAFIGTCPDCGSQLEFADGCVKCHVCGFSECG